MAEEESSSIAGSTEPLEDCAVPETSSEKTPKGMPGAVPAAGVSSKTGKKSKYADDDMEPRRPNDAGALGELVGRKSIRYSFTAKNLARDFKKNPYGESERVNIALEELSHRHAYLFVKRLFDIVFSLFVMVAFCWLFAIIAIAIKVEDPESPVFFKQTRVGKDGKHFTMYKFRSMVPNAEELLPKLKHRNEKLGPVFKMRKDPRVTRVGRILRKASLDELPQFFNVFLGQLSVVGPRPALPSEVERYTARQAQRLRIKPGITCYWQTRFNRDSISFDEWVNLDFTYIGICSIWSDFKLIIQTIGVVLSAQGN